MERFSRRPSMTSVGRTNPKNKSKTAHFKNGNAASSKRHNTLIFTLPHFIKTSPPRHFLPQKSTPVHNLRIPPEKFQVKMSFFFLLFHQCSRTIFLQPGSTATSWSLLFKVKKNLHGAIWSGNDWVPSSQHTNSSRHPIPVAGVVRNETTRKSYPPAPSPPPVLHPHDRVFMDRKISQKMRVQLYRLQMN